MKEHTICSFSSPVTVTLIGSSYSMHGGNKHPKINDRSTMGRRE